jgi:hypothetical protein
MKKFVSICVLCALAVGGMAPSAKALAPFKKAFQEKYVDGSDSDDLKAAFKKASCNTCHVKGKKKDERNPYGEELAKLIEGDANQRIKDAGENGDEARKAETDKILAELDKAFDAAAKLESPAGETYGARISAGSLPVE